MKYASYILLFVFVFIFAGCQSGTFTGTAGKKDHISSGDGIPGGDNDDVDGDDMEDPVAC